MEKAPKELREEADQIIKATSLVLNNDLNKKDFYILKILSEQKISIGDLAKAVNMAPVNLWKHLNKLKELGLISIPEVPRGQRKYPTIDKKSTIIKTIFMSKDILDKLGIK